MATLDEIEQYIYHPIPVYTNKEEAQMLKIDWNAKRGKQQIKAWHQWEKNVYK